MHVILSSRAETRGGGGAELPSVLPSAPTECPLCVDLSVGTAGGTPALTHLPFPLAGCPPRGKPRPCQRWPPSAGFRPRPAAGPRCPQPLAASDSSPTAVTLPLGCSDLPYFP